jgi:hypothetical protein
MPIIRKFAVQGHAVPHGFSPARGPFPPELFYQPRIQAEEQYGDSLHIALDDVRMFRCKKCTEIVSEHELAIHDCELED